MPPFLRHAPWFAYLAGGIVFLAVMVIANVWRARAARRRVQAALGHEAAGTAAWRDGEEAWLRGVLRTERPVTTIALVGFAFGRELVEHAPAAPEAAIDVDGQTVTLDGPVTIEVGSRVIRHHTIPTAHFEAATVARDKVRRTMQLGQWPSGIDAYHLRQVAAGDEVLARGRLVRGDDGWRVAGPITLVAIRAVVDPPPAPPLGTMARAALAGVATWAAVALVYAA